VLVLGAVLRTCRAWPLAPRFFNQRVRGMLGLPTAEVEAETLRRDLIALVTQAGEVRFSWQR